MKEPKRNMQNWLDSINEGELRRMLPKALLTFLDDTEKDGGTIDDVALSLERMPRNYLEAEEAEKLPKGMWSDITEEMYLLVCTDDQKYSDLRVRFSEQKSITTAYVVSTISAALGAVFGFSATVLAPFTVLCLMAIIELGKEVWCNRHKDRRKR